MTGTLLRYEAACRALAEAKGVDEVKDVRDKAEALRLYGRQARNKDLEVDAAEIRLRAERRLGEMLREQKEAGGLNRGGAELGVGRAGHNAVPEENRITQPPKLADLGIDKKLSSRAQKIAAVPEARFEAQMATWRERVSQENERVTTTLIREGEREQKRDEREGAYAAGGKIDDLYGLAASGFKAGTILADPPWHFLTRSARGEGRSASGHYKTLTFDEIKVMPVEAIAADDCALFLWMVDWCPRDAMALIEAWSFEHKTTAFTWAKQNASGEGWHMGQGYWTRANPEDCWLATRGNPARLHADVRQLVVAPVMEHSRKPDEVHDRIERLVDGPRLELFARRERNGWLTWGNEIPFVPHDPETGEIIDEQNPRSPSNRDASTGGEASLTAGSAGQAVLGSSESALRTVVNGLPAGREGHSAKGEGNRAEAGAVDRGGKPSPTSLTADPESEDVSQDAGGTAPAGEQPDEGGDDETVAEITRTRADGAGEGGNTPVDPAPARPEWTSPFWGGKYPGRISYIAIEDRRAPPSADIKTDRRGQVDPEEIRATVARIRADHPEIAEINITINGYAISEDPDDPLTIPEFLRRKEEARSGATGTEEDQEPRP